MGAKILRDVYLAHESPLSARGVNQAWVYWGLLVYHDLVETTPGTEAFNALRPLRRRVRARLGGVDDDTALLRPPAPPHHFVIPCDDGVADAQCPVAACPAAGAPPVTVPYTRARAALVGGVRTPLNAATAFLDLDGVSGERVRGVRMPLNAATAFPDLDVIYGRDEATARALRDTAGGGGGSSRYMALSAAGLPLWDRAAARWRIADQRNARLRGTFALHALLLREHNRRAAEFTPAYLARLQAATPEGCQPKDCTEFTEDNIYSAARTFFTEDDIYFAARFTEDDIYYAARAFVIAVAQHITLHEFMPQLLGLPSSEQPNAKRNYSADPTIDLLAAVAFRWPYTALGPVDRIVDASWAPVPDADLAPVGSACGAAAVARTATGGGGGLDAALRGMMLAGSAAVDAFLPPRGAASCLDEPVIDIQVRSPRVWLASCLDEPVIDIQAARDFGAPTYNDARRAAGLAPKANFNAITNDTRAAAALETAYGGDIEAVDMLVGGLAEAAFAPTPATVSVLGELFT
ncbi:heme peroxidase [Tribonema minus]|uniref:Heme peroxidase n=1 Tax=Tribonema minus TaxID=303371 RepID=A0A835YRQ8_9STRA|nr:heme peroxidase [Tribonema minus]